MLFDGESSNTERVLLQRAQIEQCSREIDKDMLRGNIPIPVVMILVEGGSYSVRTICQTLQSHTPLVVVKVILSQDVLRLMNCQ